MHMTFERLQKLVAGEGIAIRVRQRLQPAGGRGDKVFPPTYATGDQKLKYAVAGDQDHDGRRGNQATGDQKLKYAVEDRKLDGKDVRCVLLDSVASQANRMEEALLSAWQAGDLTFPVLSVRFDDPELADIGAITSLQAPHRIADAILRDATEATGQLLFRDTPEGRAYTNASTRNATAVFELCPTALVFGVWDSTGPKGGRGAKFQRALTSEIVAVDASMGVKVKSRLDQLAISGNVDVFHWADDPDDWTIDPNQAQKDKGGKPIPFSRSGGDGKGKKGKPSSINHSNVTPAIDEFSGGITFDHAVQTVVLSLPALRKLRFATAMDGTPLDVRAERAAQTALAALGLAAIVHLRERGYDLRSRSLLVPEGDLNLEIVTPSGASETVVATVADVNKLLAEATTDARSAGLTWNKEPLALKAAPKLVALVKRSRAEAVIEEAGN